MKELIKLVSILLCLLLLLASCGGESGGTGGEGEGEGGGSDSGNQGGDALSDHIYAEGMKVTMVVCDKDSMVKTSSVYDALKKLTGKAPYVNGADGEAESEHEIVIGESQKTISQKAYRSLRSLARPTEYHIGYVIYCSGSSIAVAYDTDFDSKALELACDKLVKEIFGSNTSLSLTSGVVIKESVSVMDIAKERDAEYEAETWAKIKAALGEGKDELYEALREYVKVYDGCIASWLANLYDIEIGGFYYSNSGRDNYGFAPDIESTAQALGLVSYMAHLRGEWQKVLPDEVLEAIGKYIKSLQDPDGYFYNYQWTKASHGTSRLARDLNSATMILYRLGMSATYNTPKGNKGDGIVVPLPDAAKPVSLGASRTVAVSRVILAAHPDYLESRDTLLKYLNDLEISKSGNFYSIGSNVSTLMDQIKARDRELYKEYQNADPATRPETYRSLVDLVIDWFNERQNPQSGHWQEVDDYNAVNGILKIMGVYNAAEVAVSHAEKMAIAAFNAVTSAQEPGTVADVFNTWTAIVKILTNLQNYAKDTETVDGVPMTGEQRAKMLLDQIQTTAPTAVLATAQKLAKFKKSDGSFSYAQNKTSSTSQGMPVAIKGTNEGDVNATALATSGTISAMFESLGLSTASVSPICVYGEEEFTEFLYILGNLGPIFKIGEDPDQKEPEYLTFEEETVGASPVYASTKINEGSGAIIEKDAERGNYLTVKSIQGNGDYVYVPNSGTQSGGCSVFEGDIKVTAAAGYFIQLKIGDHYGISLAMNEDTVEIREETTNSDKTTCRRVIATRELGKWFKLRIEHYRSGASGSPLTKIYVDGKLVAISAAFYGQQKGDTTAKPSSKALDQTSIYVMKGVEATVSYDNLLCAAINMNYCGATEDDGTLTFNDDNFLPNGEEDI